MSRRESTAFLQWAVPRLGLRWAGFRNVRGQVEKRVGRRVAELALPDLAAYRARLQADPAEWEVLRGLCGVTISRFYRDRRVWDAIIDEVLVAAAEAALAAGEAELRCWSLGCASGEEPYTLAIAWGLKLAARYPALRLGVVATDFDERVLARAHLAEYEAGSLRELPEGWRDQAFERRGSSLRLRDRFRAGVELRREDVRVSLPEGRFRVVLCRNLVFTYFDETLQQRTLQRLLTRIEDGGFLVVGRHEFLPSAPSLEPLRAELGILRCPGHERS
jgi:chemotaxis protein methyltransferase CheR